MTKPELPADGGMLYTETDLSQLFPEPLNFITSLFFLGIAVYWSWKLWNVKRDHVFLSGAIGLLFIGGIGGAIYHGLRQWPVFIMMDWMPIMLLCIAAGVYFTGKLTRWFVSVLLVMAYGFFMFYGRGQMRQAGDIQLFININYAVLAAIVLLPVLGYLIKTRFANGKWVGFALLAFVFALTFRVADRWEWLSFGTHFLWHSFGALAAFCMLQYVYLVNRREPVTA